MKSKKFKIIKNKLGNIQKIINKKSQNFKGFGELYISSIKPGKSKGWNMHKKMTINIFVIKGKIEITEKYENKIIKKKLTENSCEILTIKPMRWVKYKNLENKESKIINFANSLHNKKELLKK
tara:strand:- start:2677 stop:3045 length:369 start_codon:yes stop_codon:yes gene_type:complete